MLPCLPCLEKRPRKKAEDRSKATNDGNGAGGKLV